MTFLPASATHQDLDWTILTHKGLPWNSLEATQRHCVEKVRTDPTKRFLLLSEPPPTFTHGLSAKPAELLRSSDWLLAHGATVEAVSRGGKWTYHGPGQLVGYPILSMKEAGYSRHAVFHFMRDLRDCLASALQDLKLNTTPKQHPFGLYIGASKITSFGVAIQNGISSHGFALYVKDQSTFFSAIHPCGQPLAPVTSLEENGVDLPWEIVAEVVSQSVKKGFKSPKRC